jgi:hypothetical protein
MVVDVEAVVVVVVVTGGVTGLTGGTATLTGTRNRRNKPHLHPGRAGTGETAAEAQEGRLQQPARQPQASNRQILRAEQAGDNTQVGARSTYPLDHQQREDVSCILGRPVAAAAADAPQPSG